MVPMTLAPAPMTRASAPVAQVAAFAPAARRATVQCRASIENQSVDAVSPQCFSRRELLAVSSLAVLATGARPANAIQGLTAGRIPGVDALILRCIHSDVIVSVCRSVVWWVATRSLEPTHRRAIVYVQIM